MALDISVTRELSFDEQNWLAKDHRNHFYFPTAFSQFVNCRVAAISYKRASEFFTSINLNPSSTHKTFFNMVHYGGQGRAEPLLTFSKPPPATAQ